MKNSLFVIPVLLFLVLIACNQNTTSPKLADVSATGKEDLIKRGEYLVQIIGCHDCHSPKKMGPNGPEVIPELMLSGYAATTPAPKADKNFYAAGFSAFAPDFTSAAGFWGISFAGNLTPDATGIGTWTEEQFKKAFTQGKFKGQDGGRMLLPPMPWYNFTTMANDDVKAIFNYLKSIKPVKNVVPLPIAPEKI